VAGAVGVLAAMLYVPLIRDLFRMSTPHAIDAVVVLFVSIGALVWMEAVKHRVADNTNR
jgi:hypothetical protein